VGGILATMPETVSPEIFERFKEGFECWNDGDLDLMQDMYAEDGEYDMSAVFTDIPPFQGHEAMRRQWDATWETWEGIRMDPLEVFDMGRRRFVVEVRLWGKGRRSGAEVDQRFAFLYTLRDVDLKIIRCQLFPTVEAAMDTATDATEPARPA
jgi:ketosteroid isomerase-like protein